MQTILRRLVSGQKRRYQDAAGFDLDLAYISPRVIAMGLPAAQGKEVLYRNPMAEIARFLQTYHRGHAKVYNLCSEHAYSPQHLSVAVQQYPYDDHQVPPLALVQQFCADAAAWLAADPANVVVVHCKAGKGRTGIMICCLLLYLHKNAPNLANLSPEVVAAAAAANCGTGSAAAAHPAAPQAVAQPAAAVPQQAGPPTASTAASVDAPTTRPGLSSGQQRTSSAQSHPWHFVPPVQLQHLEQPVRDILDLYAERRTHDGKGVTIKSQRRWVGYFWAVLSSSPSPVGLLPKPRAVSLRQVLISGLAPGTADSCVLLVEARHSGSLAPRASRVCTRMAPRASAAGAAGLCLVPCAQAPMVQDERCSISTGPLGDTLAFKMPAASMGLSTLAQHTNGVAAAPAAASAVPFANGSSVQDTSVSETTAGDASVTAAMHGRCMYCCGALGGNSGSCGCCQATDVSLPGAVPSACAATPVLHRAQPGAAAADAAANTSTAAAAGRVAAPVGVAGDSCAGATATEEACADEDGCCVVEGDVRLVVMRGSSRLFYTWFNTAFLPQDGCYSLTRLQLDKPAKSLPAHLSLTVHFVDLKPTAEDEPGAAATEQAGQQQQWQRQQQRPWPYAYQEPPLETTAKHEKQGKHGKGSQLAAAAAAGATGVKPSAHAPAAAGAAAATHAGAVADTLQLQRHTRSSSAGAVDFAAATRAAVSGAVHRTEQVQLGREHAHPQGLLQQQQHEGTNTAASHGPAVTSSSAPASPVSKLRSSGSWRQHLPAISSISTSALLWGSAAAGTSGSSSSSAAVQRTAGGPKPAKDARHDSPLSWYSSSAGLSWEWDWGTLAADEGDAAAAPAAYRGRGSTASSSSADAASAVTGTAAAHVGSPFLHGDGTQRAPQTVASQHPQHQQLQQHSRVPISSQRRSHSTPPRVQPSSSRSSAGSVTSNTSRAGSASGAWVPPSIELPVIVKKPSGVDSLVAALLDPEVSTTAASQATGTAAATATGGLLASEASSGAAAGWELGGGRKKAQLRKGYSWHGNSWFAALAGGGAGSAAAAGTTCGPASLQHKHSFKHSSSDSRSPAPTRAAGSCFDADTTQGTDRALFADTAAAAVAPLSLDPVLLCESSSELPAALLGSCDPLQSFVEALLGSTDVQQHYNSYQSDSHSRSSRDDSQLQHRSLGYWRSSSSSSSRSEPCSPKRHQQQLQPHGARSGPLPLQQPLGGTDGSHAAAAAADQECHTAQHSTARAAPQQQARGRLRDGGMLAPGGVRAGVGGMASSMGASSSYSSGNSSSGRHRRGRVPRADVARLLDLEQWAEDESEGLDAAVPPPAAAGAVSIAVTAAGEQKAGSVAQSSSARGPHLLATTSKGATVDAAAGVHESSDVAAAEDTGALAGPCQRSSSSHRDRASKPRSKGLAVDESLIGLLAAEDSVAPSCGAAEAPAAMQQWQQLERAWHKSWWV